MKITRWICSLMALLALSATFVVPGAFVGYVCGLLTRVQLVPAMLAGSAVVVIVLVLVTFLFGRLYCAILCPLGVAQDLARAVIRRGGRGPVNRGVRWGVFALFLAGLPLGLVGWLEPYGIFGRFLSVGVFRAGEPSTALVAGALAPFVLILALTAFRARWWCNQICPVGTFLGLFARFSLIRVRIDRAACVACGRCAAACDKGAIEKGPDGAMRVDSSRCVVCLACRGSCSKGALPWWPSWKSRAAQ